MTMRLFLTTVLSLGTAAAAPEATLFFTGDQRISGWPSHLDEDGSLIWNSPALGSPVPLRQENMLEMRFATPPHRVEGGHQAVVTLTNGDTLRGKLTALRDDELTIHTEFAGDLAFRRSMVEAVEVVHRPPLIYIGPGEDEWAFEPEEGAWAVERGSLISSNAGFATATVEFPDRFRLGMDLAWRGGLRFHINFLTGENGSGYDLFCQENYVYLRKLSQNGMARGGFLNPNANLSDFNEKERLRLELLVDVPKGLVALVLDGRTVQEWTDPEPPGETGNTLRFITETPQQLRISRISLAPWDGNLLAEEAAENATDTMEVPEGYQQLILRNGDIVIGKVLQVEGSLLEVETPHGTFPIPVGRMRTIALENEFPETPKLMPGDVRAWFPEGGRVTFRLDDLADGKFTGYSQTFGTARFDLEAFERIEMNIYDLALEPHRPKLSW